MMSEKKPIPATKKRIRQVKIRFNKDYPPYGHLNPYQFLVELNNAVKGRYDIQFVHVRYLMTKNKFQRELNEIYYGDIDFEIDHKANNIFSSLNKENSEDAPETNADTDQNSQNNVEEQMVEKETTDFLKDFIFADAYKLEPPPDYNPEIDERKLEKQRQLEQEKILKQIESAVRQIMKLSNDEHSPERSSMRAINSFKSKSNRDQFQKNQYEIYAKGIMHEPVIEKLNEDKNSKKPLQIKLNNVTLKIYLHPTDIEETIDRLSKNYRISDWSLNTTYKNEQQEVFYPYFGTQDLWKKASGINNSIKIMSSISFNERNAGSIDSFSIVSFMWNQIILKVNVKLAQIHKIQKAVNKKDSDNVITEYYFHLSYPPMFYINLMKKQQANSQQYIKGWERVQNFVLLDNKIIGDNYLLRYYLFNNSFIKVSLIKQNGPSTGVQETIEKLEAVLKNFEGTIQTSMREDIYTSKYTLKNLARDFNYKKFQTVFEKQPGLTIQDYDKIWKIKYLLLVMVRYNWILPSEINQIINHIGEAENRSYLDCYLYVLWRTATSMWGYSNEEKRFAKFLLEEFQAIKKMEVKTLAQRIMKDTDIIIYIFRVSLTPSGYLFNSPTPQMKGRLMKQFSKESQFFLRVSLNQESQIELKNQKYITKMMFRKQMDKIKILGREYIPLGWSPSQLRSFSLWYFHEIQERPKIKKLKRQYILSFLGNFDEISNPAKKAARIGQSFSASWTYNAKAVKYQTIQDQYSSQKYLYTDGVCKISSSLLQKISLKLSIRELSVIQMRYKGAKGVLTLDPSLPPNTIKLRPSMIKFTCDNEATDKYLDILDWNKYKAGFLNRQIIILLRTLGIENIVFTELQNQHIKTLSSMTFKDCSIFKQLNQDLNTQINNLEPANQTILDLLKAGFVLEKQPFFRGVLETLKKNGYHQLKVKSNILVKDAVRIIGIIDEYRILEENQIYCSVHDPYALEPVRKTVEGPAIITRNPCLHPADIRVVNCVGINEIKLRFQKIGIDQNRFERFVNTVIFPMKGKYPLTAQISGSDLDGDNFFICWDPRLIPKKTYPINLIDEADKPKTDKKVEVKIKLIDQVYNEMLDFFIDYTNYEKLGQIDNSHLVHADRDLIQYANNKNCMKLAEIHGKAVDFPKTGYCPPVSPDLFVSEYPDFMEKQNSQSYVSQSIMGKLYRQIKQRIQNLLEDNIDIIRQIDSELILNYTFDETQQQVVQLLKIIREYQRDLENLIHLIGVDSQYEIYSGNFSTVKNKVKTFGKNRLISSILGLRERFFSVFFENMEEDKSKYLNCGREDHLQKINYFSDQVYRKAQLIYLITYIYKFPDLKVSEEENSNEQSKGSSIGQKITGVKEKIQNALHELKFHNKQGKYCGFIWFIIPKVIVNLKVTTRHFGKNNKQNLDDLQIPKDDEQGGNDNYDDGDL